MNQQNWTNWVQQEKGTLSETAQNFLRDTELVSVNEKQVTFLLQNKEVTFQKIGAASWTMPSTLFAPYGSLSDLFYGFNLLLEENKAA